jgi:hypothetical protein
MENGANTDSQLIEECKVNLTKPVRCSELDDGFRLALEQNREYDDTHPRCFTQT